MSNKRQIPKQAIPEMISNLRTAIDAVRNHKRAMAKEHNIRIKMLRKLLNQLEGSEKQITPKK